MILRWFSIFIFVLLARPVFATTWLSDGTPQNVQFVHDIQAVDGDTIALPAGTVAWAQSVNITKNVTVLGASTTINDAVLKTGNAFHGTFNCHPSPMGLLRISGITFSGTSGPIYTGSDGEINIDGVSSNPNVRVDNCAFTGLFMRPINFNGSIYGVVDHCGFTMTNWTGGISIRHSTWKGVGNYGDNSWADFPNWGSEQAVFIEDCTFDRFGGATFIDGDGGMRVVVRHCTITSSEAGNHGTETSQRFRSGRTFEIYQNHMDAPQTGCGGQCERGWVMFARGGTGLIWGNYFDRYDRIVRMEEYRYFFRATPWGIADGANGFDSNDPNGPFIMGGATGGGGLTMTDSTRTWTVNQWTGYSLRNLTTGKASSIKSNTSTTITFDPDAQSGNSMSFSAWQSYDIRRVLLILDQPGRGKGDLMPSVPTPPPVYPNQALEPIRVWGNTLGPGFGNGNGLPRITAPYNLIANRDWYFSDDNSAALPGYVPFTYPHPLAGGTPATTPTPTVSPTPSPSSTATPSPGPSSSPTTTPAATPTPTPTPTAAPTATPSPMPSATVTVTPTPAPVQCVVPNFIGRNLGKCQIIWNQSGFTSLVNMQGNCGGRVTFQSIPAGTHANCNTAEITLRTN